MVDANEEEVLQVKAQEKRIRELESRMEGCAQTSELKHIEVSLSNKPTFAEVNRITGEIVREVRNTTSLDELRGEIKNKVDKSEAQEIYSALTVVNSRLDSREHEISKREIEAKVKDLQSLVENRMSLKEAEEEFVTRTKLRDILVEYQTLKDAGDVMSQVVTKGEFEEKFATIPSVEVLDHVLSQKVDIETMVQAFKDQQEERVDVQKLVQAETEKLRTDLEAKQGEMFQELVTVVETNTKDLQDSIASKVSKVEFLDVCGQKIGLGELETRLRTTTEAVAADVKESIQTLQDQFVKILNKKAFLRDVEKLLETKATKAEVKKMLSRKAEVADVKEALSLKLNTVDFERQWYKKVSTEDVDELREQLAKLAKRVSQSNAHQHNVASHRNREYIDERDGGKGYDPRVESSGSEAGPIQNSVKHRSMDRSKTFSRDDLKRIEDELKSKASIEDVCTLIDEKASTSDVNKALKEVNRVLQEFEQTIESEVDKISKARTKQIDHVMQLVEKEMVVGRWIWNNGRIESERAVPWNVQSTNTKPSNFLWSKDQVDIVATAPGLYQVSLGFFTEKDPAVQLLVNGEPAITSMRSASPVVNQNRITGAPSSHRTAGKTTVIRRGRHSCGNVTGWTLFDFVALPAKATITILYDGDTSAQGFLSLRKL